MARVLPSTAQSMPTRPLIISWHLRGVMGNLKIGDSVWFARTLNGGWYSLDVNNRWLEGRLMPLDFNYKEYFENKL